MTEERLDLVAFGWCIHVGQEPIDGAMAAVAARLTAGENGCTRHSTSILPLG